MDRTPLNRAPGGATSAPRKGMPGQASPNGGFGDRAWPGNNANNYERGRGPGDPRYAHGGYPNGYGPNRHGASQLPYYPGRYPGNYPGRYPGYYPGYGAGCGPYGYPYYNRYPYYHRYGCYSPYYRPYYSYYYPWFYPTFSIGFGAYWGTPTYIAEPTVIYTEPTVVETVPSYGETYYTQPTNTYIEGTDPDTAYVETQPYSGPVAGGTVYLDQPSQVIAAPPATTSYSAPTNYPAPSAVTAPSTPPQPQTAGSQAAEPAAPPAPDPKLIAAVSAGNEHFAAGRYADARRSYAEATAIDGSDGVPQLLSALTSFAEADYPNASSILRKALNDTPDLVYYPFNIKALYRDGAKFQDHLGALARHVDANPSDQDGQLLLGYMWYASGDAQNAKGAFTTLATAHADNQMYAALRDASSAALDSLKNPPQQPATTTSNTKP